MSQSNFNSKPANSVDKNNRHVSSAGVSHAPAVRRSFVFFHVTSGPWNVLLVLVFGLLTYYLLFRLPFLFPPRQQLVSASYAFGFNNAVAILAMAGLLGLVTLLKLIWRDESTELPIEFPSQLPVAKASRGAFAVIFLSYAVLTWAMYIYDVRVAPPLMWETRHLLHRTLLMDLYGMQPYTQVAAEYGPILTYAPSMIYWLLHPLGATHEQTYFVAHLLLNLLGLWCVYYLLTRARMPSGARIAALIILATAGFAPWMGLNGVLARYLLPFASLLFGYRIITITLPRGNEVAWFSGTLVSVLLLFIGNVLCSAETGVAFTIAWLGYAGLSIRADFRILLASLMAFVAAALFCWLFLPVEYYGTLLRFSQGANNLPLLPAPHLLLYTLTLLLLVPSLLAVSIRNWRTGEEAAAICGAFGILCVVMCPGALGRCDPPHALLFGLGASALLMIRLANISRRLFAGYAIAYAAVFIFFLEVVNLVVFYDVSPKTLRSADPLAAVTQKLRCASDTKHPDIAMLSKLDHYPALGLPYASFGDPAVERYVVTHGKLESEYYVGTVGIYNAAELERKLREVSKAEYLLVPSRLDSHGSRGDPCAGYLKALREWFLYPAKLPCRADPLDPAGAVKSFISKHYIEEERIDHWSVLRRIDNPVID